MADELKDRLQELADKAGITLGETQAPAGRQQAQRTVSRPQQATGGSVETLGGWPTIMQGVIRRIDPQAFCNPPAGANVSMMPHKGGTAYVAGGSTWQVWCQVHCGCNKHTGREAYIAGSGSRRTQIIDDEEG